MTDHVLGLDLSLTATGAALVPVDWGGDWSRVQVVTAGYPTPGRLKREREARAIYEANIIDWNATRIAEICSMVRLLTMLTPNGMLHVWAEDVLLGGNIQSTVGMIELRGAVFQDMLIEPVDGQRTFNAANTSHIRKLLHGTANGLRDQVKAETKRILLAAGAPEHWSEDEFDAMAVANYGLMVEGGHFFSMPHPSER